MRENLTFAEIVRESYRIFRVNFTKILVLVLMMVLPLQLIYGFVADRLNQNDKISRTMTSLTELMETIEESGQTELSEEQTEKITEFFTEFISEILPYYVVIGIILILMSVFSLAIAKLVQDEGAHGALNPGYKNGEIVIIYENNPEIGEVGSVSDYFSFGLKKIFKYVLTTVSFALLAYCGFSLLVIPGIIVLIAMLFVLPITAYGKRFGFGALKDAVVVMVKTPSLLVYFIGSFMATNGISLCITYGYSLIGLTGYADIILYAVLQTAITFVLSVVSIVPLVAYLDKTRKLEL